MISRKVWVTKVHRKGEKPYKKIDIHVPMLLLKGTDVLEGNPGFSK